MLYHESLLYIVFKSSSSSRSIMVSVVTYHNLVVAALVVFIVGSVDGKDGSCKSVPSSCGNIGNISYPFGLKDNPPPCGHDKRDLVELECDSNNRTALYVRYMKFYVQGIKYDDMSSGYYTPKLWLVGVSVLDNNDSCFIPHLSRYTHHYLFRCGAWSDSISLDDEFIALVNCSKPIMSSKYTPVDTSPCNYSISTSSPGSSSIHYFYAFDASLRSNRPLLLDEYSCVVEATIPLPSSGYDYDGPTVFPIPIPTLANHSSTTMHGRQISLSEIYLWLSYGFQASLSFTDDCSDAVPFKERWKDFWRNADFRFALKK